jgi:xanthine dehydrogenase iron-sulfur cluster and FAD-binding subunit A
MQSTIRFLLGHELQEISNCDPQTTVLDWLRGKTGRKGRKVVQKAIAVPARLR